jgi:hypothetical protein
LEASSKCSMPSLKGSGAGVAAGCTGGGVAVGTAVGVTVGVADGLVLGIGVAADAGVGVGVGDGTGGCRWHWQSKKAATLRMAALTHRRAAIESELLTGARHDESSGFPRRAGWLSRKVEWLATGI